MKLTTQKNEVSATLLARHLDLTTKSIASLAQAGVVARLAHGRYDLEKSTIGYVRHLRASRTPAAAEVASERAALLRLQRERSEFEFGKQKGEYVAFSEMDRTVADIITAVRAAVMTIPERISPSLGHSRETYVALKEELRRILTDLAKVEDDRLGEIPASELKRLEENMNHDDA